MIPDGLFLPCAHPWAQGKNTTDDKPRWISNFLDTSERKYYINDTNTL